MKNYITCEECGVKRNADIAPSCPMCPLIKVRKLTEEELKRRELNKKKWNGIRLYRAKKLKERMAGK